MAHPAARPPRAHSTASRASHPTSAPSSVPASAASVDTSACASVGSPRLPRLSVPKAERAAVPRRAVKPCCAIVIAPSAAVAVVAALSVGSPSGCRGTSAVAASGRTNVTLVSVCVTVRSASVPPARCATSSVEWIRSSSKRWGASSAAAAR